MIPAETFLAQDRMVVSSAIIRRMTSGFTLQSALVQGRLAYATRRAAAARGRELGLQVMTPPQMAARLAGGLLRPASRESIEAGIRAALSRPDLLKSIGPISDLPGATRAVLRTLQNVWQRRLKYALDRTDTRRPCEN
jgi:hypothetical protein